MSSKERERYLRGERLKDRVEMMFSPQPYRKGMPLERLQLMLLGLQRIPRDELTHWLDIFEETWAVEKRKNCDDLRAMAECFVSQEVQANSESRSDEAREEQLRAVAQAQAELDKA